MIEYPTRKGRPGRTQVQKLSFGHLFLTLPNHLLFPFGLNSQSTHPLTSFPDRDDYSES